MGRMTMAYQTIAILTRNDVQWFITFDGEQTVVVNGFHTRTAGRLSPQRMTVSEFVSNEELPRDVVVAGAKRLQQLLEPVN
jgi:hypothetical protein